MPKIIGYSIPNQKETHKLSQYVDDTNFFVLTEELMIEILQFLKKHEVATGATINISKTTILPSAGGKIYNLDKKKQHTNKRYYQDRRRTLYR